MRCSCSILGVQLTRITLTLLVYEHHGSKMNRMFRTQLAQLIIAYLCPQNPALRHCNCNNL